MDTGGVPTGTADLEYAALQVLHGGAIGRRERSEQDGGSANVPDCLTTRWAEVVGTSVAFWHQGLRVNADDLMRRWCKYCE